MKAAYLARAIGAAISVASSLDLPADDAVVLQNSNRLTLRMTPCDVVARVAVQGREHAQIELERSRRLADAGCPVGAEQPYVDPIAYTHDEFQVTLWIYYEPVPTRVSPVDYARALARLHAGMRKADRTIPGFRDRIADAQQVVADPQLSPKLSAADRLLLRNTLRGVRRRIDDVGAEEQLIHGEPHPANLLNTKTGPRFIDFETMCRGPVEFDLAHVPEATCRHYANLNQELLDDSRLLVLAIVAAWRWRVGDELPDGRRWGEELLRSLRQGPPWPTLDTIARSVNAS